MALPMLPSAYRDKKSCNRGRAVVHEPKTLYPALGGRRLVVVETRPQNSSWVSAVVAHVLSIVCGRTCKRMRGCRLNIRNADTLLILA